MEEVPWCLHALTLRGQFVSRMTRHKKVQSTELISDSLYSGPVYRNILLIKPSQNVALWYLHTWFTQQKTQEKCTQQQRNDNSPLIKTLESSYLIVPSPKTQPVHIITSLLLGMNADAPITALLLLVYFHRSVFSHNSLLALGRSVRGKPYSLHTVLIWDGEPRRRRRRRREVTEREEKACMTPH